MNNPVLAALRNARLQEALAKNPPPRSWPQAEKELWLELPPHLRDCVKKHEDRRDLEIRRCHNELARARQQLKELQSKESNNGTNDEISTAANA